MTKLERVRTAEAVPAGFRGAARVGRSLELLRGHVNGTLVFKPGVWGAAKPQLRRESTGKCAYCESPTDTVAHGDVEHFRPKSVYWWLAYCYDNYVFACQVCNQVFKRDAFPVHAMSGRWAGPEVTGPPPDARLTELAATLVPDPVDVTDGGFDAYLQATAKEKAGLPDPYLIDPEPLFRWVANDVLQEVEARAASRRVASTRAFAAAVECCGINRDELKRWRWATYAMLVVLRDSLAAFEDAGIAGDLQQRIRDQIRAMMRANAPYAGMVRYFVRAFEMPL